jgi:predicted nucleic acid-binding protein
MIFTAFYRSYQNVKWIPPDLEIADTAARLRAEHRLQTPDALQAATAVHAKVSALITNDAVFTRVKAFHTVVLDELL